MSPGEASLRGRLAAHVRWSREDDRRAATAKARAAFLNRFEQQVDPTGRLEPTERARRAENARKAHFAAMALKRHHS